MDVGLLHIIMDVIRYSYIGGTGNTASGLPGPKASHFSVTASWLVNEGWNNTIPAIKSSLLSGI